MVFLYVKNEEGILSCMYKHMTCLGFDNLQDCAMLVSIFKCMINFLRLAGHGIFVLVGERSSYGHAHILEFYLHFPPAYHTWIELEK